MRPVSDTETEQEGGDRSPANLPPQVTQSAATVTQPRSEFPSSQVSGDYSDC